VRKLKFGKINFGTVWPKVVFQCDGRVCGDERRKPRTLTERSRLLIKLPENLG